MKKIFILIFLLSSATFLSAQEIEEKNESHIIFNSKPKKVRGFAGPLYSTTYLNGNFAYMSGFNAAGIFNDHFIFGVYNLSIENALYADNNNYVGNNMVFDQRGLWLGYIFMPKSIIHFNINAQIGKADLDIYDDVLDIWYEDDIVFILNPSIEAEVNLAKFLKIGIGANYRIALGVDKFNNYSDNDFSDFGAFVSFKFGWFN